VVSFLLSLFLSVFFRIFSRGFNFRFLILFWESADVSIYEYSRYTLTLGP